MTSNVQKITRWDFFKSVPGKASAALLSTPWQRRAAMAVGGLLLLWALAYAALPSLLKWQLQKIATDKLGRQVTLGAVNFKPWSLELTLDDLAVAKAQPTSAAPGQANQANATDSAQSSPQLHIKRIYIDAEMQSLLRLAPVADAIVVEEPVLSLTHQGEGRYDIDDMLERLKPATNQPAGKPAQFALYNLVLSGGRLDYIDQPVGKTHELRELNFSVPFLSNLASKRDIKTAPHLAFKLNGSRFDTAAEGTPFAQTRKTDAQITLRGVDLSPYLAYWPASLPFQLQSGVLNADVKVAFEQTPNTVVRLSGSVTAEQVRLRDTSAAGREMLAFERLHVSLEDVRPLEQFVKLSAVELSAPTLQITRDRAGRLNLLPPVANGVGGATKNIAASARPERARGLNDAEKQAQTSQAVPSPASSAPAQSAPTPTPTPASTPWKVQVAKVTVRDGRVHWLDETLATPAQIRLSGVTFDALAIAMPFAATAPLQFSGSLGLDPAAQNAQTQAKAVERAVNKTRTKAADPALARAPAPARAATPARVNFSGSATDQAAQLTASVAAWPLDMAAKYVGQFLLPALGGQLDARLGVSWQAASGDRPQALQVSAPQIALSDVLLAEGETSLVSVQRVALADVAIDVPGQSFKAANMQLVQPRLLVERGADKRWMYQRWMVSQGAPPPATAKTDNPASAKAEVKADAKADAQVDVRADIKANAKTSAPSWAVAINDVQLDGGALSFSDKAGAKPVAFDITELKAQLGGLVLDDRLASQALADKPMPLSVSLRLASGRVQAGTLDFKGSLALSPLQAQGQLQASRLPVQAFEPYFASTLNIEVLRADTSFKGRLAYRQTPSGPQAQLAGDLTLEQFKANTLAPKEDLLAWKALNLRGLNVALDPAKATRVDVKETVLTDFFARVIVTPEGRINLQDLLKPSATASAAPPEVLPENAIKTIAASARPSLATAPKGTQSAAFAVLPAAGASAALESRAAIVNFGPMSLINGKVLFSDRLVKPNYSADLTELTGKLSAFSSVAPSTPANGSASASTPDMADLELSGKAEGTASLEILGKLNPLAKPLALDIKGKVRDLDLPPLSPYSVKYAGYGIKQGKLSVDVNYVVQPDGRLTATNKVILKQLSFGDKVEGSQASLPVKLAVALLADRNGVIDMDLPISGSLNDPQFSLGPVIIKVIVNVIVKAVTAPFSLLANALGGGAGSAGDGGGEEPGFVSFTAGSAVLAPEARARLDKVAQALLDRPALKLTVAGTSSLEAERDGVKRERLGELVLAEKRRQQARQGLKEEVKDDMKESDSAISTPADSAGDKASDYPALLKQVYQRADMPKPRNLIGLARGLPDAEMEKLLLADIPVSEDVMRALAQQRGVAVKDFLTAKRLPPEQLVLGASKVLPPDAKWTPRAELNLAMP
ncbi:DUF748 domain-containing protein [Polaromonas sp.]|uniref:DUF748 domain-containing protein n=1 Tax=Polaromonas sp. TaxID=1869339 RepID=UPI0017C5A517|nr:DUF748 domain-containing protein [Polaromonas sp.]NMM08473.1 DUF748 domain-containing protein [Polaromonas sp.]